MLDRLIVRLANLADHGTLGERILAVFTVSLPATIWWRFEVVRKVGWLSGIALIVVGCAIESFLLAGCWVIIDRFRK
jgi:hypothetical protein